jgi:hypothetical protein
MANVNIFMKWKGSNFDMKLCDLVKLHDIFIFLLKINQ